MTRLKNNFFAAPRRRLALLAFLAVLIQGTLVAHAVVITSTFASFQNGGFQFANTGVAATTGLFSVNQPLAVNFEFHETVAAKGVVYAAFQNIPATLTLTSQVADVASGGRNLDQPLQSGNLEFVDALGNDLLTVSSFTADITGRAGGGTANLGSDTTLASFPDTATYSSDFLTFSPPTVAKDSTGLTLELGTLAVNANGYLNSFTANGDGSFSGAASPVAVPEPSSLALLVMPLLGLVRRRVPKRKPLL